MHMSARPFVFHPLLRRVSTFLRRCSNTRWKFIYTYMTFLLSVSPDLSTLFPCSLFFLHVSFLFLDRSISNSLVASLFCILYKSTFDYIHILPLHISIWLCTYSACLCILLSDQILRAENEGITSMYLLQSLDKYRNLEYACNLEYVYSRFNLRIYREYYYRNFYYIIFPSIYVVW